MDLASLWNDDPRVCTPSTWRFSLSLAERHTTSRWRRSPEIELLLQVRGVQKR
jgi:hypothetical protein